MPSPTAAKPFVPHENRRDGDRIIQDANPPIRNNQYNAFAYSPETFPPASPPMISPEPQKVAAALPQPPAPAAAAMPKTVSVPMPLARPQLEPAAHPHVQPAMHPLPRPPEHRGEPRERFSLRWWHP